MFLKSIHNDKFLKSKKRLAIFMVTVFIMSVTTAYAAPADSEVIIMNGNSLLTVYTEHDTVDKIISQQGIEIEDSDFLYPRANSEITPEENVIVIKHLKKVDVIKNNELVTYWTGAETFREFVQESENRFDETDSLDVDLDSAISDEQNVVNVTTVTHESLEEIVAIPYKSTTTKDSGLEQGKKAIKTAGKNGSKKLVYDIVYHNGAEVERNLVEESVITEAVDEVVRIGTKVPEVKKETKKETSNQSAPEQNETKPANAPAGAPTSYKKVITCSATAYDLSFESCGKRPGDPGYGMTASGTMAKIGTVAVDPRVIPLGTKMYIVSTDGKYVYGYCTAEDTGGGIKGNKVDLFFNTRNECLQFGRRQVNVYIL